MTNADVDFPAPYETEEPPVRRAKPRKLPTATNVYTVFLLLLILAAMSVVFFDVKAVVLLVVVLAYAAHLRLMLTQRAEQRRTNDLLEELLDAGSPLPRL